MRQSVFLCLCLCLIISQVKSSCYDTLYEAAKDFNQEGKFETETKRITLLCQGLLSDEQKASVNQGVYVDEYSSCLKEEVKKTNGYVALNLSVWAIFIHQQQ